MLNIGILGPGRVANRFATAMAGMDNVQLWSVCGQHETSLRPFVEKYEPVSSTPGYLNSQDFFNDDALDAVIIATPDIMHESHIYQAIAANKHFLVEKPLCTDLYTAINLVKVSERSTVKSSVGYHLRWHKGLRALKSCLQSHELGNVFHMNLRWMHRFVDEAKWRKDKNRSIWWSLTTLGTHCIDLIRWYLVPLCGEIVALQLLTSHAHYESNDETAILSMRFANGATATMTCSILFDSPLSFEIYTDKHTIIASDLVGELETRCIMIDGDALAFHCDNNVYQDEITDLVSAITADTPPEVSLREGYYNVGCLLGQVPEILIPVT